MVELKKYLIKNLFKFKYTYDCSRYIYKWSR